MAGLTLKLRGYETKVFGNGKIQAPPSCFGSHLLESQQGVLTEVDQKTNLITLVMREREAMVRTGKELLALLEHDPVDAVAFRQKALEFLGPLANFGSFFDIGTQERIQIVVRQVTAAVIDPNGLFVSTQVRAIVSLAIGIQADFNKKPPFRAVQFDVKAFGAGVKGIFKR